MLLSEKGKGEYKLPCTQLGRDYSGLFHHPLMTATLKPTKLGHPPQKSTHSPFIKMFSFNFFRFQPPRQSASEKENGGFLSHAAWSKIVLGAALVIIIFVTNMNAKRYTKCAMGQSVDSRAQYCNKQ